MEGIGFIIHLRPEVGGSRLFRNVGRYLLESTERRHNNQIHCLQFYRSGNSKRQVHTAVQHSTGTDRTGTDRTGTDRTGTDRTAVSQAVQTEAPFLALHVAPFRADISAKVVTILKRKNSKSKIEVHGWNKNIL